MTLLYFGKNVVFWHRGEIQEQKSSHVWVRITPRLSAYFYTHSSSHIHPDFHPDVMLFSLFTCVVAFIWCCSLWTDSHQHNIKNTTSQQRRPLSYYQSNIEWWEAVPTSNIYLRKIDLDVRKVHSCYEYKVFNKFGNEIKTRTFCYPSVIITGYKKCSTSALYALLSHYPTTVKEGPGGKENCAFHGLLGKRKLDVYFDSLPERVAMNEMIIDGCIYLESNLRTMIILRNPNTFYVVSNTIIDCCSFCE